MRLRFWLAAAALSLAGGAAHAASFDCLKATSPDERAICADRSLNDQDVRMGLLYELTQHLVPMGTRDNMKGEQRQFLIDRRACGARKMCLNALYVNRLGVLGAVMTRVEQNGPF